MLWDYFWNHNNTFRFLRSKQFEKRIIYFFKSQQNCHKNKYNIMRLQCFTYEVNSALSFVMYAIIIINNNNNKIFYLYIKFK